MNLNELIPRNSGGCITLPSGEIEGPLLIDRPVHIKGDNTTIWAKNGPVIEIISNGAVLENIRVEITEGIQDNTAINAEILTVVKNIEVLGAVKGFGAEDGSFDVPRTIDLGEFRSEAENTFRLTVNVPAKTEILSAVKGITFTPNVLKQGRNELMVTVSGAAPQTVIYAEILFRSGFIRRVYLCGRSRPNAHTAVGRVIYTAPERAGSEAPDKCDVISVQNAGAYSGALEMERGRRAPLTKYTGAHFEVFFTYEAPRGMEIDPYVFLLEDGEKALGDEGLVFFGNERSPNGEAVYFPSDGHLEFDLSKADSRVKKISLAYAIYAGSSGYSFSMVKNCRVSIRSSGGEERISFMMRGLSGETTVVALELYLYKGEWKINAVGAGYKDGMARLCNRYGIEVV